LVLLQQRRQWQQVAFFFGPLVVKKAMGATSITFFFGSIVVQKAMTTRCCRLLLYHLL
jgi:hypothetical protein